MMALTTNQKIQYPVGIGSLSSENEQSKRNELELGTLYRAALHTSGTKLPALIVGDP
jgi:hypothetical protein